MLCEREYIKEHYRKKEKEKEKRYRINEFKFNLYLLKEKIKKLFK